MQGNLGVDGVETITGVCMGFRVWGGIGVDGAEGTVADVCMGFEVRGAVGVDSVEGTVADGILCAGSKRPWVSNPNNPKNIVLKQLVLLNTYLNEVYCDVDISA